MRGTLPPPCAPLPCPGREGEDPGADRPAAQVFYHLGELNDSLHYALCAGDLFDVASTSDFVRTLVGKCLDEYIRHRNLEEGAEGDPRMEAVVERMFERCIADFQTDSEAVSATDKETNCHTDSGTNGGTDCRPCQPPTTPCLSRQCLAARLQRFVLWFSR